MFKLLNYWYIFIFYYAVNDMLPPSYGNWAPFIGEACSEDEVHITEYMKVSSPGSSGVDDDDNILNEDYLIELMTEKKVCLFLLCHLK